MISEPFGQPPELSLKFLAAAPQLPAFLVELYGAYRVSARLSGRAKGTRGSVSVTVNRHEELSDRSAPYADFGHGSLFEAAPGARRFVHSAESPTKSLFKPFNIHKHHIVASMCILKGVKRFQAVRPRAPTNLRALDTQQNYSRTCSYSRSYYGIPE